MLSEPGQTADVLASVFVVAAAATRLVALGEFGLYHHSGEFFEAQLDIEVLLLLFDEG